MTFSFTFLFHARDYVVTASSAVSCRPSFVSMPFPLELMTTIHATRRRTVEEEEK